MNFINNQKTAVLEAYGFPSDSSESDIVACLFRLYKAIAA